MAIDVNEEALDKKLLELKTLHQVDHLIQIQRIDGSQSNELSDVRC